MKEKIMAFIRFSRRVHLKSRLLALALSLVLAFYMIPTVIFAEVGEAISSAMESGSEAAEGGSDVGLGDSYRYNTDLYEVVEQREESVKHFHLPDGTYLAAQYPYPVHITDDSGKLVDIDNTLTEDEGGFGNKSARIKFAKKTTGNETLFTLSENNTKITLSLIGANKGVVGVATNGTDAEEDTELGKKLNLENLTSSVLYADILPSVDLEYVVQSLNIKENIIVKERSDSYSYAFEVKLNNLTAELSESGDVHILDNGGNTKYIIPAPVVYDADGVTAPSDKAYYTLTQSGKKYTLTVTADPTWMNAVERAFPVTVDPSLTVYGTSNIIDTYIEERNPDQVWGSSALALINNESIYFFKLATLPTLPTASYVTKATLSTYIQRVGPAGYIGVHRVVSAWDETLTWNGHNASENPAGVIDDGVVDYVGISTTGRNIFDITTVAGEWYFGVPNHGIALKVIDETASVNMSTGNAGESYLPVITVEYINQRGVEDYMPMTSYSLGAAGVGGINLATGQTNITVPLIGTTDSLMPLTLSLVYNSDMANKSYYYPKAQTAYMYSYLSYGWKLNICQSVISKSYTKDDGTSGVFYTYLDADGTEHFFYLSETDANVYYDEDGLKMKLTVNTDGSLEITDPSQQILKFTAMTSTPAADVTGAWYLSEIGDSVGNAMRFTVDADCVPTSISLVPKGLSPITMLYLHYNSYGFPDVIYHATMGDAVIIRYSNVASGSYTTMGGYLLRDIEFVYSESSTAASWINYAASPSSSTGITVKAAASYSYDTEGRIYEAKDKTKQQGITHEWGNGRVSSLTEVDGTDSVGQKLGFVYYPDYTEIQSSGNDDIYGTADDIKTRYILDGRGRAVSTYSYSSDGTEIYGAVTGEYETQENAKNNLANETVLANNSPNYLLNGHFKEFDEGGALKYWTVGGNSIIRYGNGCILAKMGSNGSFVLTQYVELDPGDYTLSFIAESRNCADLTGLVTVTSVETANINKSEEIPLEANLLSGTSSTSSPVSVPFNVSVAEERLKIEVTLTSATVSGLAEVALYTFMLSEGVGVSDYNLVGFGDFNNTSVNASGVANATVSDYWQSNNDSAVTVSDGNDALFGEHLTLGATLGISYAKQRIFEITEGEINAMSQNGTPSNVGTAYTVSGFGKAAGATASGIFAIRVDVYYYQNSYTDDIVKSYYFNFSPSCTDWQFAGGSFNTEYDKVSLDNEGNLIVEEGYFAWVRAIDVVCEFSYQAGNIAAFDRISVCEDSGSRVDYSYYDNGLVRTKDYSFHTEYYEYNEDNQITRAANSHGELTDYTYTLKKLTAATDYDFTYNSAGFYPIYASNPDSLITKTAKKRTTYTYNTYGLITEEKTELLGNGGSTSVVLRQYTYNTSSSSRLFGAMLSSKTPGVESTRYFYSSSNGRLVASVDEYGTSGVHYTYNDKGDLISVKPARYTTSSYSAESTGENVTYGYDDKNQLSTIVTRTTRYSFTYDVYGNTTSVKAGSNTLAQYSYNANNGKLCKITYGNGFSEEYVYNEVELLSEIWYTYSDGTREKVYSYEYTKDGQLYKFCDHIEDAYTVYYYTGTGKLARMTRYDGDEMEYGLSLYCYYYSDTDMLSNARYRISYYEGETSRVSTVQTYYDYNLDGTLSELSYNANGVDAELSYTYDAYDRLSGVGLSVGGSNGNTPTLTIDYGYAYRTSEGTSTASAGESTSTYASGGDIETSYTYTDGYVSTFTSTVNGTTRTYTYEYDSAGNITKITDSGGLSVEYTYDNLSQLTSAIYSDGYEYYYSYDKAGNITSKTQYVYDAGSDTQFIGDWGSFTYSSSEWGDQMVSTQGIETLYDNLGNPTYYYNCYVTEYAESAYSFTWNGKLLATASRNGTEVSYTYNDEGIRTSKTVNGVTTTYHLNGSQIIAEETDTYIIVYLYDAAGLPIGMQYREFTYDTGVWDTYFFEKNIFGDIVAVYGKDGTKYLSYSYDAWGSVSSSGSNGGYKKSAAKNPFTYRGYYYDSETNFYYLNSRYYDPFASRFISPDNEAVITATPTALTDKNLYAYCDNNPITRVDNGGEFWHIIVGGVLGGLVGGLASVGSQLITTGQIDWGQVGVSAGAGAISGALASTGLGPAAQVATNALISGTESILNQGIEKGFDKIDYDMVALDAVVGGVTAVGNGVGKGTAKHLMTQGINGTKGIARKGLRSSLKYYASQTYTLFYKGILKRHSKMTLDNIAQDVIFNMLWEG